MPRIAPLRMTLPTLSSLRERLALALTVLLPLHALLVTVGTKVLLGPHHAPMSVLAVWKEVFLLLILCLGIVEIIRQWHVSPWRLDAMDYCIIGLLLSAVFVQLFIAPASMQSVVFAIKYDVVPLILFAVLRRVEWSEVFKRRTLLAVVTLGVALSLYGLCTLFLPEQFFLSLGYSPANSLYTPDQPLSAFQLLHESVIHRVQSTMSGPNQFGLWLLLPLSILLVCLSSVWRILPRFILLPSMAIVVLALFFTFSRTAWVAAFVLSMLSACSQIDRLTLRRWLLPTSLLFVCIGVAAVIAAPTALLRMSSSRGHITLPLSALSSMIRHPLGQGLGSIGPASNAVSEACVFLRDQDDPVWAKEYPDLCVFTGEQKVQPLSRECRCSRLAENWYLQIGVELGWFGLACFVSLMILLLVTWRRLGASLHTDAFAATAFLFFAGVAAGGIFLHAWEDSAVAYTSWLFLAVALSRRTIMASDNHTRP